MAVRSFKRTKRRALRRQDLQAQSNVLTMDSRNNPTGSTSEPFTLVNCTIQPASGDELQTLDEGLRDAELFTIFTDTPVRTAVRGTANQPDEVYLDNPYTPSAGWFTVIKSKVWQNSVIPHYKILVVRKNPD